MLKDLYELQKIEAEERRICAAAKESQAYRGMKKYKASFDNKMAKYNDAEKDLASLTEQLAEFPGKLQELKAKLEEEKNSMYDGSVENVKEMEAREAQIAALEDKIDDTEALQTLYTGEKERKEQAQQELKLSMAKDYAAFKNCKADYLAIEEGNKLELEKLAADKEAVRSTLSDEDKEWYAKYGHKCGGTPIARLGADQVCQGCFTIVPPVTYHRTVQGQDTYCEKCGRVLFIDPADIAPVE